MIRRLVTDAGGETVRLIEPCPQEGCGALITFDTGLKRWVPEHKVVYWDFDPGETA